MERLLLILPVFVWGIPARKFDWGLIYFSLGPVVSFSCTQMVLLLALLSVRHHPMPEGKSHLIRRQYFIHLVNLTNCLNAKMGSSLQALYSNKKQNRIKKKPKMRAVSCIEEEAMSLSVFDYCIVIFLIIVIGLNQLHVIYHPSICRMLLFQVHRVPCQNKT